jgi:hypothetical protein
MSILCSTEVGRTMDSKGMLDIPDEEMEERVEPDETSNMRS